VDRSSGRDMPPVSSNGSALPRDSFSPPDQPEACGLAASGCVMPLRLVADVVGEVQGVVSGEVEQEVEFLGQNRRRHVVLDGYDVQPPVVESE
jgi:hypothetical protein